MDTHRQHIKDIIRQREGLTQDQAEERFQQHRQELINRIESGELPFDYCYEQFGLEPDYLEDFLV